jgi:hypothetical protein
MDEQEEGLILSYAPKNIHKKALIYASTPFSDSRDPACLGGRAKPFKPFPRKNVIGGADWGEVQRFDVARLSGV